MASAGERYERLVERYARVMAKAVRRVCGRRHRALVPDIEQEVRLALWKRLRRGNEIQHPVSYVYRAALTTALAVVRRSAAEELPLEDGMHSIEIGPQQDERGLLPPERARLIEQVLEALPEDQARALRAWLSGFSHAEVAELFGWTESVARHRIYRGLDAVKRRKEAIAT